MTDPHPKPLISGKYPENYQEGNVPLDVGATGSCAADEWRCPGCGSSRWVAVADYPDGPRIRQCVPCGRVSSDAAPPATRSHTAIEHVPPAAPCEHCPNELDACEECPHARPDCAAVKIILHWMRMNGWAALSHENPYDVEKAEKLLAALQEADRG